MFKQLAIAIDLEADYQDERAREYRRWLRRTSWKPFSYTREDYARSPRNCIEERAA